MNQYCKAYRAGQLRRFDGWDVPLGDDEIVYLWDDLTVVTSPVVPDQDVLFTGTSQRWASFCRDELGFQPPSAVYKGES